MWRTALTRADAWFESRYTGLFTALGSLPPRAHDPELYMVAGTIAPSGARHESLNVGGAGLDERSARLACIGEAIERAHSAPLPRDACVRASFSHWPGAEPALDPARFVLFLPEQYSTPGFPFRPFGPDTVVDWQPFRDLSSGRALWVPEDLAYLHPRPGAAHGIAALTSTGLSAGTDPDIVLRRGMEEVIERDALLGAWWSRYPIEEIREARISEELGSELWARFRRPNLEYRFFRVRSPYSDGVTIVLLRGDEPEGHVISTGAACRESLRASFVKSCIEAVQGRHHARWVLSQGTAAPAGLPTTFVEHALHYTRHPERLADTVFARAPACEGALDFAASTGLPELVARLGPDHPVLFRIVTPPVAQGAPGGFLVLKVSIVGLQPLHGDHRLAHLGGPLWAPRTLADFAQTPPHPFA